MMSLMLNPDFLLYTTVCSLHLMNMYSCMHVVSNFFFMAPYIG